MIAQRIKMLFILVLLFLINCISIRNYSLDRARDAKDTINIGVEKNIYGFSFLFINAPIGWQIASNGKGFGLRHGHIGTYDTGDNRDNVISYIGGKIEKGFKMGNSYYFPFMEEWESYYYKPTGFVSIRSWNKKVRGIATIKCSPEYIVIHNEAKSSCGNFFSYDGTSLTGLELSIGMHYGVRFGININEIFDFLLGIFTIDVSEDDISKDTDLAAILNSPIWEKDSFNKRIMDKVNKQLDTDSQSKEQKQMQNHEKR